MKYIVIVLADEEHIFVFPECVDHARMREACERIRFGDEKNFNKRYRDGVVVSAGFIRNGICWGRSETLNLSCRPRVDQELLEKLK